MNLSRHYQPSTESGTSSQNFSHLFEKDATYLKKTLKFEIFSYFFKTIAEDSKKTLMF